MEIRQLNENKLRVCLDETDLKKYNLNLNYFLSLKIENSNLFIDILKLIYKNNLLPLADKSFSFDSYLINNSKIIINIYITKSFVYNSYSFDTFYDNSIFNINKSLICEFNDFNNLYEFIKSINLNFSNYPFEFFKNMYISEFNNNYFFILENLNLFSNFINYIIFQLSEFSDSISFSEILIFRIKEYGNIIFNFQNINSLIKLL